MSLAIAQLGQPILRQRAVGMPLEDIASSGFQQFLREMLETLRDQKGAGLAAPQVFDNRRVFLAAILPPREPRGDPEIEAFINPQILGVSEDGAETWEGCLSFPELVILVPRPVAVRIQYWNAAGDWCVADLIDFPARVVQHEYDHLEGILTLDRAKSSRHIVKASELDAFLGRDKASSEESERSEHD